MDISWDARQLIAEILNLEAFSEDVIETLSSRPNGEYLDAVATLALSSRHISAVFTTHNSLFVEICGRWLSRDGEDHLLALSSLSRVLSIRPCLRVFATALLTQPRNGSLKILASRKANGLQDLSQEILIDLLLTLYRLLVFDNAGFAEYVAPAQLQSLLAHSCRHIRFMAVKILGLYLHASDAALCDMIQRYVGEEAAHGPWEGKVIDYRFLALWEKKRLDGLVTQLKTVENARKKNVVQDEDGLISTFIKLEDFSATTAHLGGVLVPRFSSSGFTHSSFVMTESSQNNISMFAEGLNLAQPLIVTGLGGSGKTSMIRHAARLLGVDDSMVTLHLNEQTDAKTLIGMYVNEKDADQFTWKPGVLTKAVLEGRWLVIEDLDRAPREILSLILPLLERRELFVPNWGENIRAHPGFMLIATVCTFEKPGGDELDPSTILLGRNHWSCVAVAPQTITELTTIIKQKHPLLKFHLPQIIAVYTALKLKFAASRAHFNAAKPFGPRELLQWSARIETLLINAGVKSDNEPISNTTKDGIFLEAIDCFAAATPGSFKEKIIEVIATELQMPRERATYCLHVRVPRVNQSETIYSVGRVRLSKSTDVLSAGTLNTSTGDNPFAISDYVARILESVSATVKQAEPCLLVGETGTGKTTVLQRLAHTLNKRLVVINLSQQSESGDLLGSFKPINMRSLAMPMRDEFNELLLLTFASKTNQQIMASLDENIVKSRWPRVHHIWRKAIESVQHHFETVDADAKPSRKEPQSKRRKVRREPYQQLQPRWKQFEVDLERFNMYLSSRSKGAAFSFVEGSVVKAVRRGDWLLLDEINLASPDTLESLTDLLYCEYDGRPSLLLSETGSTERIRAHVDFRIFGAMNPATDAGKKDLPPSIRSRFSEFYVDGPDCDLNNLVPLVKAYLGNNSHLDIHLATDTAELYLNIKDLERANVLADGSDRKAHFSLRNLSRALNYAVDLASIYGFRRALYEGFCMTFTTSLNKKSEMLLRPLIENLVLSSSIKRNVSMHQTPRFPQDDKRYVQLKHYRIAQGTVPVEKDPQYIRTPFVERNLLNLVRATSTRKYPVLLQGPTSSGKTSMVEYLAKVSGNKFVRINNHEHTDLQEYLGSYMSDVDGIIKYQEGLLVQALKEGSWIVLDELNLAPTDVLEALNRLLDDNRELFIPDTQQVIRPHENFMLFATQNPPGLYGGRKVLSRAFQNRFLELHFDDIPEDELETILRERSQIAPSFCKKIVKVYQRLSILRQTTRLFEQRNSFATLRDLFRWALRDADDLKQLAINGFLLLAERVRDANEQQSVKRVIEEVMKVKIDEDEIYSRRRLEESLGFPLPNPQGITWTKSMRRLYVLVTQALKNHEPVLLVGHTGLGKTTICQAIAETMGTQIHIVNAHQNMETGDLVGAQRPIRNKAAAQEQLSRDYESALMKSRGELEMMQYDLEELAKQYESLIREKPENVPDELKFKIQQSRSKVNALFQWSDSSLVEAMRAGHHFLLDEISLADDSVLERLNSVLEPGRSLLLAEKGTNDAQITALDSFQFLATMNPGGDYGKRELSPALRNRFTEIWVPNVSDEAEMLEIIRAKLPEPRAEMARPMIDFAVWHASRSNANAAVLSIRDLLSWAKFIDIFQDAETEFLAFHGAATVYLDGTSLNSTAQLSKVHTEGFNGAYESFQKLGELFQGDIMSNFNASPSFHWDSHQFQIGDFSLMRNREGEPDVQYSLNAPTTRLNAMKVIRALQLRKPILLEGSPGVGKTTLITTLAHAVGVPLVRINLSDQTDLMDLFGSDIPLEGEKIGHFGWRDAPFLRAMQNGDWVLLDEMNLASQTVLEGLNACFDHRGQVYISELNRTFQRHPNFVVFAAQNPQSQGGGRKGLPASFVNRFTTVRAASFTAEDLQLICEDLFPNVSAGAIKWLIHSLLVLNTHFDQNPRLATSGGPWLLNLRDILRWLHLLTSRGGLVPLASPIDFINLIILQRFRSLKDRESISRIVHESLDHTDHPPDHYHALTPHTLQVGLATLPRNNAYRPEIVLDRLTYDAGLENIESIMICIQMNWPCLLIGPTDSGKTTAIRQIASCVGAELVSIALNPDTDTSDLVGGLEQSNANREVDAFVKRVKIHTEKAIIQSVISGSDTDISGLLELEGRLSDVTTDIIQSLQAAARRYPSSIYPDLLQEYRLLMERNAASRQARFEWVDGLLVHALKHGKWLMMNDANLCEASVLDRINSLLEPNGQLSMNEHRNLDGSAQVVKPHPAFRLFMTMDPRNGELSRAMRNRSVEIYMPAESSYSTTGFPDLGIEAALARFQHFQVFDWDQYDDIRFEAMMNICLQHLSVLDFKICDQWKSQVSLGLTSLNPRRYIAFQSIVSVYQDMIASGLATISQIKDCYLKAGKSLDLGKCLNDLQSIHPLNNPMLLSARSPVSEQLQFLGHRLDLMIELRCFRKRLAKAALGVDMRKQESGRDIDDGSMQKIASFLEELSSCLENEVDICDSPAASNNDFLQCAKETMAFLADLLDSTIIAKPEEGIFAIYQSIGWSLAARRTDSTQGNDSLTRLANQLASRLSAFNTELSSWSGLAMEQLWSFFKPTTASSKSQFEMCMMAEALADRFDALKWGSGIPIHDLAVFRDTLIAVNTSVSRNDSTTVALLQRAKSLLARAEQQTSQFSSNERPHFQAQFKLLTQLSFIEDSSENETGRDILNLLADRPTKASVTLENAGLGWQTLSQVNLFSPGSQQENGTAIFHQTFLISMIKQLREFHQVPLSGLRLLTDEIKVLCKHTSQKCSILGDDVLTHMDRKLSDIRSTTNHVFQTRAREAQKLPYTSLLYHSLNELHALKKGNSNSTLSALSECASRVVKFDPAMPESPSHKTVSQLAKAWIQFFAGLLLLYLPDRPLDPALRPFVELTRHKKRTTELNTILDAMKTFQMSFAGQESSYRIRLLEKDLHLLGTEPTMSDIHRPAASKLFLLQGEFNSIMKSIVLLIPDSYLSDVAARDNENPAKELEVMKMNIRSASSRLSSEFREYDDITKPLLAMLQGLDVGLSLAMLAGAQSSRTEDLIAHVSSLTPFMGATPLSMLSQTFHDVGRMRFSELDLRLFYLETVAVVQSVEPHLTKESEHTMFESFHSLYQEWKEKLNQDQKAKAAESSLYKYRGLDDENQELDSEDLVTIFQDYDGHPHNSNSGTKLFHDPKAVALRVSHLHREIFQPSETATSQIVSMIGNVSNQIARLWSQSGNNATFPVASESLLPALILNLHNASSSLHHSNDQNEMYNFYVDANVGEAEKVVILVRDIQARFHELQQVWPEHAILADVLKISNELLSFEHSVSVAKLLTKVEQLHFSLNEWQAVASREFSAVGLFDRLTNLIVSWRRLELSTWGRLLDMEDKLCKDDADSWWFIAYEAIIAAPMSLINEQKDVAAYSQHLYTTLEKFLATTSKGQYKHRLNLLRLFEAHSALLAKEYSSFNDIRNLLANFLRFHRYYDEKVQQNLKEDRKPLERDLKEVLLLASWKDTNIIALRDSAKRSHHKLFKLVRKYRSLLAQPPSDSFKLEIEDPIGKVNGAILSNLGGPTTGFNFQALGSHVMNWVERNGISTRLRNSTETAHTMLQLSHDPNGIIDAAFHLNSFVSDLVENISLLQKETPSNITPQNKRAIKHLTTRKRKLFSYTLKAIRQMGFRNNVDVDTMKKQETTAAILSHSPSLGQVGSDEITQAERYFDRILGIMPRIRENITQCSDDLTHAETSKSTGYIESMLHTILRQRSFLARSAEDIASFNNTCVQMRNMWDPQRYTIQEKDQAAEDDERMISRQVHWLSSIVEVAEYILNTHQKLSESDSGKALSFLIDWKTRLFDLRDVVTLLPKLPQEVSSTAHIEVFARCREVVNALRAQLKEKEVEFPNLAFIFKQIEIWTIPGLVNTDHDMDEPDPITLNSFAGSMSDAVDSILVAVQHMRGALDSTPVAIEDTRWLLAIDKVLANGLDKVHGRGVNHILEVVLSQIPRIDVSEDKNFDLASGICAMALPIVQQYHETLRKAFFRYANLHLALCRLVSVLAKTFLRLVEEGFCGPTKESASGQDDDEKLEGGIGLGDGEGAEDISKDVEDDEDLTDLAQKNERDEAESKEDIQDQDNAVDMNHDDMVGESGDAADDSNDEDDSHEGDDTEVDDEVGSVDDLDPGAVDEKLWDNKDGDDEKDKLGDNAKSNATENQVGTAEKESTKPDEEQIGNEDENEDEGQAQNAADEAQEIPQDDLDRVDPYAHEEQNLDLPEEMDLDMENGLDTLQSEDENSTNLSDVDGEEKLSDSEERMQDDQDTTLPPENSADELEDEHMKPIDEIDDIQHDQDRAGSPIDTEPEDESDASQENREISLQDRTRENPVDPDDVAAPSDTQGLGQDIDQTQADDQARNGATQTQKGAESTSDESNAVEAGAGDNNINDASAQNQREATQSEGERRESSNEAFKKIGDALEEFHKQLRRIQEASDAIREDQNFSETQNREFEYLGDDKEEDGTQALGPTSTELARPLRDGDIEPKVEEPRTFTPDLDDKDEFTGEDKTMEYDTTFEVNTQNLEHQTRAGAFIGQHSEAENQIHQASPNSTDDFAETMDEVKNELSDLLQPSREETSQLSSEDALQLWSHYEVITQDLSFFLTEQLRLILTPTQATKMRGDFRTGKRLNLKRIIPYIASNFKQDKIWMRRSIPTKRNYQILLALDDSRSMSENGSGRLAFQTLAVMTKSLSVLEVGEICIVGFGDNVFVAHDFGDPFTSEAGANILQRFGFQQESTNVASLVDRSTAMLRNARLKQTRSSQDLLQLEIIISDGLCEDHEKIKRLVRQATEERIMIIFVIIDARLQENSIIDLTQAVFEEGSTQESTGVRIKRYLDGFPFTYYLVVGDVRDLPRVLVQALRQWFAEVVGI